MKKVAPLQTHRTRVYFPNKCRLYQKKIRLNISSVFLKL